jgi:hypothetical protein
VQDETKSESTISGLKDLRFDNIVIFLIKNQASYLSDDDINNIKEISKIHREMVDDVLRLRGIGFSKVILRSYNYANQTNILQERVDLATACAIHYSLNTSMVVQYLKGKYVGEFRDVDKEKCHLTSAKPIASTSSISSIRDARLTSILKRIMIINTWPFGRETSKPFSSFQRSLQRQ